VQARREAFTTTTSRSCRTITAALAYVCVGQNASMEDIQKVLANEPYAELEAQRERITELRTQTLQLGARGYDEVDATFTRLGR
jgi:hypothetical protein